VPGRFGELRGFPLPLPPTARCGLDANPSLGLLLLSKVQFAPGSKYRRAERFIGKSATAVALRSFSKGQHLARKPARVRAPSTAGLPRRSSEPKPSPARVSGSSSPASVSGGRAARNVCPSTDHYDRAMADDKRPGFIAGGPRRARNEEEGFWAFLRDWVASIFRVDRRM
jgi:hypothetical protein